MTIERGMQAVADQNSNFVQQDSALLVRNGSHLPQQLSNSSYSSSRHSPSPLYRRDVHAHYDRLLLSHLNVSFVRETQQLNFYKFRFIIRVDGNQWETHRSSADLVDLDEQLHSCTFTRRHSNLPMLSAEKFALSEVMNKKERQLRQLEIRDTLDVYMKRLSSLLEVDSMRISCMNVLQFFEVNNKGEHDANPVPSPGIFVERTDPNSNSYFDRLRRTFRNEPECRHGKVFGVDLTRHVNKNLEPVPCILTDCTTFIEHNLARGIYRISSVSSQTAMCREIYNNKKGAHYDFTQVSADIHSVACLMKMYFRMLPRKLFHALPTQEVNTFTKSTPIAEKIRRARELTYRLSTAHFRTAAYLMRHLAFIAEKSSFTNMDAANLALVWSPNLFRVKSTRDQMTNMNTQNVLVEVMIRHYKEIFYEIGMNRDSDLISSRSTNGQPTILPEQNNNNNSFVESTDDGLEIDEESDGKSNQILMNGSANGNCKSMFVPRDHQRVRSEEPPNRSIVLQMKRNLRTFGTNLKTSFRNLVGFHRNSSSSSLSNSSMEFFQRFPQRQNKYAIENSTVSLNMATSPVPDTLIKSEPCGIEESNSNNDSLETAVSASPLPLRSKFAPKAELDAMSMDSLPFEASRYDNLELVQRRGSMQHKRLVSVLKAKTST